MSDDIITLSSDDEFESPPPKRIKPGITILNQLHNLKEITASCQVSSAKTVARTSVIKKTLKEENSFTIIIDGEEKHSKDCSETNNTVKDKENGVVNLIDEFYEEYTPEQKNNASSDCLIVGSDSDNEAPTPAEAPENVVTPPPEKAATPPPAGVSTPSPKNESTSPPEKDSPESSTLPTSPCNGEVDILQRPSTSTASEAHKLLDEFLENCAKSLKASKYESRVLPKFSKMKKNFSKCESIHQQPFFKKMLQEYIGSAKISAPEAVVSFQRLYSYLLDHINGESVDIPEEDLLKIKKLERACKSLIKWIKRLEHAELNFDDEEDSTFMQLHKYQQRLNKVYDKYCQLLKRNPQAGRLTHEKVVFVNSKYNEINKAITKSYKNNQFPSYYDVEKCIRKCVAKHNLSLSESDILEESKHCFTKMGNLLQMKRKRELYEVHSELVTSNDDPANEDEELKRKLQENHIEGSKKLKEVVDKFVKMQENNVNVELSEDSDDSNYRDTDSESEAAK